MIRAPSLAIASRRPTVAMYDEASWTAALENVEATKAAMPRQVKCSQVDTAS